MTRASILLACGVLATAAGCGDDTPTTCAAADGTTATCEEACTKLYSLDCRVGDTMEECVSTCTGTTAPLGPAIAGRVRACYAMAGSCAEVDGCSLTCGPGGGPVVFPRIDDAGLNDGGGGIVTDAGGMDAGVGNDASVSGDAGGDLDAGVAPADAGSDSDAGRAGGLDAA